MDATVTVKHDIFGETGGTGARTLKDWTCYLPPH